MAKLLLDEWFFKRNNDDGYIDKVLDFIRRYFSDDIVLFQPFNSPQCSPMYRNAIAVLGKKIMSIDKLHLCDANLLNDYTLQNSIVADNYSTDFVKKIAYIRDSFNDVIVFNAPENHSMKNNRPSEHVYLVNHVKKELNSNIAYFIANNLFMDNVFSPQLNSPLPNIDLCSEYKSVQDELIQGENVSSRIPHFLMVCEEVLHRNVYVYNESLSSINSTKNKIRKIYQSRNLSVYGCIDVDTGSIEICDHKGHHVDEFGFDNRKHNKRDLTGRHNIKLHK